MVDPVKPTSGDYPLQGPDKTPNKPADNLSFKKTSSDIERKQWWGDYFSEKQLNQFKNNLIKFISAQIKSDQERMKQAMDKLKRVSEGSDE